MKIINLYLKLLKTILICQKLTIIQMLPSWDDTTQKHQITLETCSLVIILIKDKSGLIWLVLTQLSSQSISCPLINKEILHMPESKQWLMRNCSLYLILIMIHSIFSLHMKCWAKLMDLLQLNSQFRTICLVEVLWLCTLTVIWISWEELIVLM